MYPAVNKNIVYNGKISALGLQRKQLTRVTEIAPGVSLRDQVLKEVVKGMAQPLISDKDIRSFSLHHSSS